MRHLMTRCRRWGLLGAMLVACGLVQEAQAEPEAPGKAAVNPDGSVQDVFSGSFYRVRPDFRRCVAPLCGGYWVALVNRASTICADGISRPECYVAEIARTKLQPESKAAVALVRGTLRDQPFAGFGRLGVLVAEDAWQAAGSGPPTGTWHGLRDAGIRCITFPCSSLEERALNAERKEHVSTVDLEGVDATPEERKKGYDAVWEEAGLIATGKNVVDRNAGPAGDGLTMVASQFFLKLDRRDREPAEGKFPSCRKDSDCTASIYTRFVSSPEDCYCPTCQGVVSVVAAELNELSWHRHCRAVRLACPAIACIALWPDPRCIGGKCESGLSNASPTP